MKTLPIATNVANKIINLCDAPYLEWDSDKNYVVIKISGIILDNAATQTTVARRKRFNRELEAIMVENGWVKRQKGSKTGFLLEKYKEP